MGIVRTQGTRAARLGALVLALVLVTSISASAHAPTDSLHGGEGEGAKVVGHSDLGGAGLNGGVAVLGDHAYVGQGTNGGFASMWNKSPTCKETGTLPGTVKVVSLADPADPTVVSTIQLPQETIGRDVAVLDVEDRSAPNVFTGDLLAVALESCNNSLAGVGGIQFYDVSDPANPALLSYSDAFPVTREVSLVQRPDGRAFALSAVHTEGIHVTEVTNPAVPQRLSTFSQSVAFSEQECRPFTAAQGVSVNADGSRAYAALQDVGLSVLDISDPDNDASPPELSRATYSAEDEGNQFRYVPNAGETLALATDEDLQPAETTLSVDSGSASTFTEPGGDTPGEFRGCEAIWGGPLFEQPTPSITTDVAFVDGGGCSPVAYEGVDVDGKIVLTERGGSSSESPGRPCSFDERARRAQEFGGVAAVVQNTVADHHAGGSGRLFAPDSVEPADAGVSIPMVMITREAGQAIRDQLATQPVTATLADEADTWGALRVFDLSGSTPTQVATAETDRTTQLTPGEGRHHAVQPLWAGTSALTAWMSDGLRVFDLSTPSSPKARAYFVPPAFSDPNGDYDAVPLVVDVARFGDRFVVTDINGGLYVLNVVLAKDQCKDGGHTKYGFTNQGECVNLFDDD